MLRRNKTWFKSKYEMRFTEPCIVVDGEDDYRYFIYYRKSPPGFNFKICLFDIIPLEIYEINTDENMSLIHG